MVSADDYLRGAGDYYTPTEKAGRSAIKNAGAETTPAFF
jgi:hypothetical protein